MWCLNDLQPYTFCISSLYEQKTIKQIQPGKLLIILVSTRLLFLGLFYNITQNGKLILANLDF